jgi:hypothetical protein
MTMTSRAAASQARLKRVLLAGTLAAFLSFFGLALASDWATPSRAGAGESQVTVRYRTGQPATAEPHVRTRSS